MGLVSEQLKNLASNFEEDKAKKPRRKEAKQISFRVSDDEYLKLKQSAETLNMSVPAFVKSKAQGSRLVTPKIDVETRKNIVRDLNSMGTNINQIAKWFNSNHEKAMNLSEAKYDDLLLQIKGFKEELNEVWQRLN